MTDDPANQETSGHEAQRALEHKALRNVRGLVDRMEADDAARHRSEMWIVAGIAIVVILLGAIMGLTVNRKPDAGKEIPLPPVSKAPSR